MDKKVKVIFVVDGVKTLQINVMSKESNKVKDVESLIEFIQNL